MHTPNREMARKKKGELKNGVTPFMDLGLSGV